MVGVLGAVPLYLAVFRRFAPNGVPAADFFSLVLAASPEISEFPVVGVSPAA
jgi:hypothetical protein